MSTIRLTMGQALLKFLDNQYIEFDGAENKFIKGVFTVFGHGVVVGFGEALEQYQGDMVVYQGKNEQGMAHAAMGYAKQKNRREIMACTSSIGPGALNMVTAAGTASVNRIPVLFLPGDTFACRQPDPVLQQIEHPFSISITANDAFKAVSRYWDRIARPEQLMSAMINAMRVLTDPADTGAVTICLPQDVEGEVYDYPEEFFEKRVHYITRRLPTKGEIERAVELIKKKKKPIIICMEYGFSCMGYEVCAALGVKIAELDKEVYSMVGDGSYLMLHSELVTSIQEGRKINVLLFDNSGFGCIENLQNAQGIPTFATKFTFRDKSTGRLTGECMPIDYAMAARGYGVKTYTARTAEELNAALESVKKDTVSTLIDIKVLPKTMTGGYESWWRVGVPEVSERDTVCKAYEDIMKEISKTKKF